MITITPLLSPHHEIYRSLQSELLRVHIEVEESFSTELFVIVSEDHATLRASLRPSGQI